MDRRSWLGELILYAVQRVEIRTEPSAQQMRATPLGDWLTPGRFGLILGLLIFAAFPQVVLGWQTFVVRDFGFFAENPEKARRRHLLRREAVEEKQRLTAATEELTIARARADVNLR